MGFFRALLEEAREALAECEAGVGSEHESAK